ncbi:MAG: hypothetical protein HN341_16340 [Verrucomicrobia bacterium]|nr:hypothetical protein [Verrucomicrobiota bacterium]
MGKNGEQSEVVSVSLPREGLVVLGYVLLALVLTWPLAASFGSHVIGSSGVDVWDHLWTMDGMRQALLVEGGGCPFVRELAYFPQGLFLFPVNLVNELISVPFQATLGLIRAFNLLSIWQLVFAAWAAYQLALLVVRDRRCAFIAGMAFASAPAVMSPLHNGTTAGGNAGWIAFYLWILLRQHGSLKWYPIVAGAVLGLVTLMCWYYGAFCFMATLLFVGLSLVRGERGERGRMLGFAGLLLVVATVAVVPLGLLIRSTLEHPDAQNLGGKATFVSQACEHEFYASTLRGFFDMGLKRMSDGYAHPSYLGFGLLLLAVVGLVRGWRTEWVSRSLCWWLLAAVFALLSLGPVLWVDGEPLLKLPYYLAMKWVPLFHYFEFPFRFIVVTSLALSVLAAVGLSAFLGDRPSRLRLFLVAFAGVLVVAEHLAALSWPMPVADARIPGIYHDIAGQPGEGAVLDLPLSVGTTGQYLYFQTVHRRPVPVGINRLGSEEVEQILSPAEGSDAWHWVVRDLCEEQLVALHEIGVRFLVWHRGLDERGDALGRALEARGVPVLSRDQNCIVFDLAKARADV